MTPIDIVVGTATNDFTDLSDGSYPLLVSDLALGGWKPHAVARELLEQLVASMRTEVGSATSSDTLSEHSVGDIVGRLIDAETTGNIVTITAYNHASTIARLADTSGPFRFVVIGPTNAYTWDRYTVQFLIFLGECVQRSRVTILVENRDGIPQGLNGITHEGSQAHSMQGAACGTVAAAIPGTFDEHITAAIKAVEPGVEEKLIMLRNGVTALESRFRNASACRSGALLHELLSRLPERHWLHAFALSNEPPRAGAASRLYEYAKDSLSAGDTELGLKLLDSSFRHSTKEIQRWVIASQLQGMRIGAVSSPGEHAENPPDSILRISEAFCCRAKRGA